MVDIRPDVVKLEIKDSGKASETTAKVPRQVRKWPIELPHLPSLPGKGITQEDWNFCCDKSHLCATRECHEE